MPIVQRLAQLFGAICALAGAAGPVPPLVAGRLPGVPGPPDGRPIRHSARMREPGRRVAAARS